MVLQLSTLDIQEKTNKTNLSNKTVSYQLNQNFVDPHTSKYQDEQFPEIQITIKTQLKLQKQAKPI